MKAHTEIQIIKGSSGKPAFVVIPYNEYESMINRQPLNIANAIPSEVIDLVIDNDYSPARAWREYLDLTQEDVAKRLGISQAAYSQHERADRLKKSIRQKIATALGITLEQLSI
ncbi:MAG: helix-turn-helix domain-containing protein [Deferribacteraceae bacterium]|jgi:DNA-binding XRE family transcriptional regulator|nr:helix-turn-helix domain-containing protein [Deferribacteraceae bacterium]